MKIHEIAIDPELEKLLHPLTQDERNLLVESLKRYGLIEPLIVWKERGILVDGHHRFRILLEFQKEVGDRTLEVIELSFDDTNAVKAYMLRKQLGRRNLNDAQRVEIALMLKPLLEARAKENQKAGGKGLTNLSKANTRTEIAKSAGVSEGTVQNVSAVLKSDDQQTKDAMRAGEISPHAAKQRISHSKRKKCVDEARSTQEPSTDPEPADPQIDKSPADQPTHVNAECPNTPVASGNMSTMGAVETHFDGRVSEFGSHVVWIWKNLESLLGEFRTSAMVEPEKIDNWCERLRTVVANTHSEWVRFVGTCRRPKPEPNPEEIEPILGADR